MSFLAAWRFLLAIPIPLPRPVSERELGRSVVFFPVIGLILGLILAGADWLLSLALPAALVNAFLMAILALLTGALHLDGFMDTCDGLAGRSPQERLEIMRDSRVGGFGVAGLFLLLLAQYAALQSLPANLRIAALVAMPVLGRWAVVYAIYAHPYARPQGLGRAFKEGTRLWHWLLATAIALAIVLGLARAGGLIALAGVWLAAWGMAGYFRRRLGGLTGDSYGAINEVCQVLALVLMIISSRIGVPLV